MDLTKTKAQLEKELAIEHPSYPPSAIESLAYTTFLYYITEKERRELQIERDMWKEKYLAIACQ